MSQITFNGPIQLRRDTAANWTSNNPTLAEGEAGLELDTGKLKFGDGTTAWTSLDYFSGGGDIESITSNTTVNFNSSMTVAEMQALIDAQPKLIRNGAILTFQFADGTYDMSAGGLTFAYFYGSGRIRVQGNTGESTGLHTTQAVHLDGSSLNGNVITMGPNNCAYGNEITRIKITVKTSAAENLGLYMYICPYIAIQGMYFLGTGTSYGHGIKMNNSFGWFYGCYVSNIKRGFSAYMCHVISDTNDDTGTPPAYGLIASDGSTVAKNSTQPAGSTSNELTASGGVIR